MRWGSIALATFLFSSLAACGESETAELPPVPPRLACGDPCPFVGQDRICPLGAWCAAGDGNGVCHCGQLFADSMIDSCAGCIYLIDETLTPTVTCAGSNECGEGSCVFDVGCDSPRAFCTVFQCEKFRDQSRPYCSCDGETRRESCPSAPYRHFGPCE